LDLFLTTFLVLVFSFIKICVQMQETMSAPIKQTTLNALHKRLGAKMAPFAGYEMPIQYPTMGVLKEHLHTRSKAGVFDVAHMGQVRFFGKDREAFLEWVTPADIKALPEAGARLTVLTNEAGGVIDDCIITRFADHAFVVINAGCKDKDLVHLNKKLAEFKGDVHMEVVDRSLIALQGPKAMESLSAYVGGLEKLPFMTGLLGQSVKGMPVQITRCGYTGEDGFEIAAEHKDIESLTNLLLTNPDVQMIGLGARDSLRMEAGMCLYGHELDETINPVSARLMWTVTKRRIAEGGFIGYDKIKEFKEKQELVPRLRVGIVSQGSVARENVSIVVDGKEVGRTTSGCPSPSTGKNVAMGYIDRAFSKNNQKVMLNVRNKMIEGTIVSTPFHPTSYYKLPA
jgi:aminomethyltransferase